MPKKTQAAPKNVEFIPGMGVGTSGWRTSESSNRSTSSRTGARGGKRLVLSDKPHMARAPQITGGYKPGWMGQGKEDKPYGLTKREFKAQEKMLADEVKRLHTVTPAQPAPVVAIPPKWQPPVNVADVREQYEIAMTNHYRRKACGDVSGAEAWMVEARRLRRIFRNTPKGKR